MPVMKKPAEEPNSSECSTWHMWLRFFKTLLPLFLIGAVLTWILSPSKKESVMDASPHEAFLTSNYITSIDFDRIWPSTRPMDVIDACRKDKGLCAFWALNRYGENVFASMQFQTAQLSNEWLINGVEKAHFAYCKKGKRPSRRFLIGERPLSENGFKTFYAEIKMIMRQTGVGPAFLSLDDPRVKALELRTESYQPVADSNLLAGLYPGAMFRLKDRDLWVILVSKEGKQSLVFINTPKAIINDRDTVPYC